MADVTHLTDDVYWIHGCHEFEADDGIHRHVHSGLYLIVDAEANVAINSGDYDLRYEFEEEIDSVTDGQGLDAIFVHESHVPNSANVESFREKWDAEVIFPGGAAPVHGFPEVTQWPQHGEETLRGRRVGLAKGPLLDLGHTTWIFDHQSGVFFTCEGFCSYHSPGECDAFSDGLDGGFAYEEVRDFYADMLLWLQYVDSDLLVDRIQGLLNQFDIEFIAPAHGNPILGADLTGYTDHLYRAIEELAGNRESTAWRV